MYMLIIYYTSTLECIRLDSSTYENRIHCMNQAKALLGNSTKTTSSRFYAGTKESFGLAARPRRGGDLLGESDLRENLEGTGMHHGALAQHGSNE